MLPLWQEVHLDLQRVKEQLESVEDCEMKEKNLASVNRLLQLAYRAQAPLLLSDRGIGVLLGIRSFFENKPEEKKQLLAQTNNNNELSPQRIEEMMQENPELARLLFQLLN
jgi:hypothetical protein